MVGERNKDKREFLAFYWEGLEPAKDGTGPLPTGTRRAIIDTALGYFNCLNADEQKTLAVKQAELLTRRKDVDGKHGHSKTDPPTAVNGNKETASLTDFGISFAEPASRCAMAEPLAFVDARGHRRENGLI